ncbi:MAG: DM13 domain-containing protein [Acidobacteriota bacterium]
MSWIQRNVKIVLPVSAVALIGVGYLAVGVFGVHTLFIDDRVDEAGPVFDSGVAAAAAPVEPAASEPDESATTPASDDTPEAIEPATPTPADEPVVTDAPAPEIVTLAEGEFVPLGRYSGEGTAVVLNDGSDQRFLRFENFSTDNGPDLRVYLTASGADGDSGAFDDDFVDLGVLKGNIGDQNYEIPPAVDLSVYDTVVVWCVRFSTPFTAADLA